MGNKRVLVIAGHPVGGFGAAAAAAYVDAAQQQGHEVRLLQLDQLRFDPVLHHGYKVVQPLEPDLLAAQEAIVWAEHLALVYPIWWGSVPALLKGFLDRVLLPGFAFKFHAGNPFPEKLLKGRTAHLLVTMDTPPWYFHWIYRAPGVHQMRATTLELCGVRVKKTLSLGPMVGSEPAQRDNWLSKVRRLANGLR